MTHGFRGYRLGCKCEVCRVGNNAYMREYMRNKIATDPSYRKKRYEYRLANKDKKAIINKRYYENNLERVREANFRWKQENWDRVLQSSRLRKHRKRATNYTKFSIDQLNQRLSMWPGCWICGGAKEEIDHVKPLSKGGWHILANLRPICKKCNLIKGAKWPIEDKLLLELRIRI